MFAFDHSHAWSFPAREVYPPSVFCSLLALLPTPIAMSAVRLCLDGVQILGEIETRLPDGLIVDGRLPVCAAK
eukprot:3691068-Pleurochrysis_carterae.AAC.1